MVKITEIKCIIRDSNRPSRYYYINIGNKSDLKTNKNVLDD